MNGEKSPVEIRVQNRVLDPPPPAVFFLLGFFFLFLSSQGVSLPNQQNRDADNPCEPQTREWQVSCRKLELELDVTGKGELLLE